MKEIINCPSPAGLPYGFRGKIAKRMHVHPNTVSNILNTGNSHPKWWEMVIIYDELCKQRVNK